ncbi:MAG: Na/Pi cotransporter family protein [Rhodobacteraceae bacterium]|nr:Na/Pi cotransporter family protein [Paracoccaceae bacterium]
MSEEIYLVLGGVGMFLLGMKLMTGALKEAAGSNLRDWLSRFTTTPLRGVATGAVATAIIQSSSATTVMTVGFVGAGLLTLAQSLGVIYGANIGTTATGWLVSLLGFKMELDTVAMVVLLPAALADLLTKGLWARIGRVVAGLCLLLIGLELMQDGMKTLTATVSFASLPSQGFGGLLILILAGAGFTVLVQSSSAAIALALVLLESGAIGINQGAAMLIGMNIGTTATAMLASIGGSRPMRQTAVANLLFNLATSFIAFPIVLFGADGLTGLAETTDPLTALLLFHLGFNLVGTLVFLPLTPAFSALIHRLVPDETPEALVSLDAALLQDSGVALVAAQAAAETIARHVFTALSDALSPTPDYRKLSTLNRAESALDDLQEFLADIRLPEDRPAEEMVYSALLHETDHLLRLLERARQTARIETLLDDRILLRPAVAVGAALGRQPAASLDLRDTERLARLHGLVVHRKARHRRALLLAEHAGIYSLHDVFAHTDAMRWLERTLHHGERVMHYNRLAEQGLPPSKTAAK